MTNQAEGRILCIGHRGAMGHEPENTLLSVEKALYLRANCIEIDVQYVDNRLMVFHDERLERTTNGSGSLASKDFQYLRSLDAGKGQRIPVLEEVLDIVDMKAGVNIELKGAGTAQPVVESIARYREKGWSENLILVSSFDRQELLKVRELDGSILLGVLFNGSPGDNVDFAKQIRAYSLHPSRKYVGRRFVDSVHEIGFKVYVFTVDRPDHIERMKEMGVDGVFTNYPERVVRAGSGQLLENAWI